MDENFKKLLEENGASVDATLKRFMNNESIYMKFIMKFLDDKNFDSMREEFENGDFGAVFNSGHTLKGVTANLGLDPITAIASRICDMLRNKQPQEVEVDQLGNLIDELGEVYYRFKKILEENKG